MTTKSLQRLYEEHSGKVSDKWSIYLPEYDRAFSEYRDKPVSLLEIGVQNGGSLEIWFTFFPNAALLAGCDINPDCANLTFEDPRISVVVGDANSDEAQASVLTHAPAFDVVIDDGSHRSGDIEKSFARYFPCLNDGGIFVAEDRRSVVVMMAVSGFRQKTDIDPFEPPKCPPSQAVMNVRQPPVQPSNFDLRRELPTQKGE